MPMLQFKLPPKGLCFGKLGKDGKVFPSTAARATANLVQTDIERRTAIAAIAERSVASRSCT